MSPAQKNIPEPSLLPPTTNGFPHDSHENVDDVPIELLDRELPVVYNDQIPLGDLLQRVMQSIYAELSELAETLPNMSDVARKRTLADWVVKIKKQVVKLYAVAKWSRDADVVQKCMNITAFLMGQNQQFEDVTRALKVAKDMLDPARLRNHDLLTSLDVLTTGSYLRLPTCIKKSVIPPTPLTDLEVQKTLSDMEEAIRYRLCMNELIPVEMSQYRIADGRVYFTVPKLFEASLCLLGADPVDGWFFVHVEFLIEIAGGLASLQEFPRIPTGLIKRHVTDEADARLAYYLQLPEPGPLPPGFERPPRPTLAPGYVDAPLVRIYNFLQMMSLSYQLEILWYQAQRMRALGWVNYMTVQMTPDRKSMTVSYWIRPPPPGRQTKFKLPLLGGKVTVAIVETHGPPQLGPGPSRSPKTRMLAKLQQKSKLGNNKPSDDVEGLQFDVRWEPEKGALGVIIPPERLSVPEELLQVDSECLDFEAMLKAIIERHAAIILSSFHNYLQNGPARTVFGAPGVVTLINELGSPALRIHLCAEEVVIITIDTRTGRITLRDTGDLAAAGRGPRFTVVSARINDDPTVLLQALVRLRVMTITDLIEQKAKYIGLQSSRSRNFRREELEKLNNNPQGNLFIQLATFPNHYLVIVITDERLRFALITTVLKRDTLFAHTVMDDIAWLDFDRIRKESLAVSKVTDALNPDIQNVMKRKRELRDSEKQAGYPDFEMDTQMLKELYSYCCARVAYMNVERQLKLRAIPFTHVNPASGALITAELAHVQSPLARSVPALCVQSKDILSGAPAAEAAMPNIRVVPLHWWSEQDAKVVTCVKLKYVQQPMGKTAGSTIIRPSKRIIYDTKEAVVSFLSENVNTCVDEFLEEWARVSKMVVIAREVAQMSKQKNWDDIRLLSFDLQTVEFAYAENYTVSLTCEDQLSPTGGNFDLRFARRRFPAAITPSSRGIPMDEDIVPEDLFNPHDDAEPFFRDILRHGQGKLASSLHCLVTMLRETLPIVAELEAIRRDEERNNRTVDTFPKSAGWYRLLYGDLRHALDFRLMGDQKVVILDASYSIFPSSNATKPTTAQSGSSQTEPHSIIDLQPIPQFCEILADVVKAALAANHIRPNTVARLDVGVVCECSAVRKLARAIHTRVMALFLANANATTTTMAPPASTLPPLATTITTPNTKPKSTTS